MLQTPLTPSEIAPTLGDFSLAKLDNDKLDLALDVLRGVAGAKPDPTLTRKEEIIKLCESIKGKLAELKERLEKGGEALTNEENKFLANVSGIKDKLTEGVKVIDDDNIEIFKRTTNLGHDADELTFKRAINYANDLRRAKISDSSLKPTGSNAIATDDGLVHKHALESSSWCYDTAFKLVTGKHYSSLLGLRVTEGNPAVVDEINRVGGIMFEALKTYLKEKHGDGAISHLNDEVKAFWVGSFRDSLVSKLNN